MHRICGVEMVLGSGNGVELRIDDDDERGEERTGGEISLLCCAVLCCVVEREVDLVCRFASFVRCLFESFFKIEKVRGLFGASSHLAPRGPLEIR